MNPRRREFVCGLALATAGCLDPTGSDSTPDPTERAEWRTNLGAPIRETATTADVAVATTTDGIAAVDPAGEKLCEETLEETDGGDTSTYAGYLAVADGSAYTFGRPPEFPLLRFDANDGSTEWTSSTALDDTGPLTAWNGLVFSARDATAVDATAGERVWSLSSRVGSGSVTFGSDEDHLYIATDDSRVLSVDAEGTVTAEFETEYEYIFYVLPVGDRIVCAGSLDTSAQKRRLRSFAPDGTVQWSRDLDGPTVDRLTHRAGDVYVPENGTLLRVPADGTTETAIETVADAATAATTAPTWDGETAYVGAGERLIVLEDGERVDAIELPFRVATAPLLVDGRVVVSGDGGLAAVDVR
jgi:hypothetical protein